MNLASIDMERKHDDEPPPASQPVPRRKKARRARKSAAEKPTEQEPASTREALTTQLDELSDELEALAVVHSGSRERIERINDLRCVVSVTFTASGEMVAHDKDVDGVIRAVRREVEAIARPSEDCPLSASTVKCSVAAALQWLELLQYALSARLDDSEECEVFERPLAEAHDILGEIVQRIAARGVHAAGTSEGAE